MTPVLLGLANDDGVIMLKVLPPQPAVHWLWKVVTYAAFVLPWLATVVGVAWSG